MVIPDNPAQSTTISQNIFYCNTKSELTVYYSYEVRASGREREDGDWGGSFSS